MPFMQPQQGFDCEVITPAQRLIAYPVVDSHGAGGPSGGGRAEPGVSGRSNDDGRSKRSV